MVKVDHVTDYATRVINGEIVASKKVIKQCERHMSGLEDTNNRYQYNVDKANEIINFMEMLPNPKDGKPMKLASFQKFIVGSLYGNIDIEGKRKYKRAYISVARKNSKSILTAGLILYEFLYGKSPMFGRQLYCTANNKEQARIVFKMVVSQLEAIRKKSPAIRNITKIIPSRNEIHNLKDGSIIRPLSKDTSTLDGFEPLIGILDEYHESKDNKMIEVLRSGQVLLDNPLTIIISTAGFNMAQAPMYQQYEYLAKVLEGKEENDSYFTFIAEQDDIEEVYDESTWEKSNPLLEIEALRPVMMQNLRDELQESVQKQDMNGVLTKNFNMWRASNKDSYIPYTDWVECSVDEPIDIRGREVYLGVDLSRQDDLTAIGMVFPLEEGKYYADSHVFVGFKNSIESKSQQDKIDYMQLVETDMATLTNTASGIINYVQVIEWIDDYVRSNNLEVKGIMYDPWNSQSFIAKMEQDYDYPLIEVTQNARNLSPALKQFKLDVYEKKILHSNNPNLNLAINHAITVSDNNSNIVLDKKTNRNKIDALAALVTAFTMAMHYEFEDTSFSDWVNSDNFGF